MEQTALQNEQAGDTTTENKKLQARQAQVQADVQELQAQLQELMQVWEQEREEFTVKTRPSQTSARGSTSC